MIYIIMGVSGCGKSTLGAFLSEKLGWPMYEGDNFHPPENIEKMARGEPLTDQDRLPWLLKLHEVIEKTRCSGSDALVACSALKQLYRQILLHGSKALAPSASELPLSSPDVFLLFLHGSPEAMAMPLGFSCCGCKWSKVVSLSYITSSIMSGFLMSSST
ncbi:uncharacterized protein V6R79_013670 [Siganus canaliculatus]